MAVVAIIVEGPASEREVHRRRRKHPQRCASQCAFSRQRQRSGSASRQRGGNRPPRDAEQAGRGPGVRQRGLDARRPPRAMAPRHLQQCRRRSPGRRPSDMSPAWPPWCCGIRRPRSRLRHQRARRSGSAPTARRPSHATPPPAGYVAAAQAACHAARAARRPRLQRKLRRRGSGRDDRPVVAASRAQFTATRSAACAAAPRGSSRTAGSDDREKANAMSVRPQPPGQPRSAATAARRASRFTATCMPQRRLSSGGYVDQGRCTDVRVADPAAAAAAGPTSIVRALHLALACLFKRAHLGCRGHEAPVGVRLGVRWRSAARCPGAPPLGSRWRKRLVAVVSTSRSRRPPAVLRRPKRVSRRRNARH